MNALVERPAARVSASASSSSRSTCWADRQGVLKQSNATWMRTLGWSSAELATMRFDALVVDEDR